MRNILIKIFFVTHCIILPNFLFAQVPDSKADTGTLEHSLKKGALIVQFRTFFMSTLNEGKLSDYYALATGAGIGYHTPEWKGFSAGMSTFIIFNIASSDFTKTDSLSDQKSRYEIGLFDITNPGNKFNLARMEELYIKYSIRNTQIIAGRQFIKTPFINKQDGRMRPTLVEGIYFKSKIKSRWTLDAGWLTEMAPRTTVSWYSIGESIGIYPPGVNVAGAKSAYPGNTKSKGVGVTGMQYENKLVHLQLWNTYVENIMNIILIQPEIHFTLKEKNKFLGGLQYVYQHSSGDGGNKDISKRYYEKGSYTRAIGARMEYESPSWKANLNYLHISKDGRFLMPREWGIEPFYTFLPRERNEGLGGSDAWSVNNTFFSKNKLWKLGLSYGQYFLPHPHNFRLNKYGIPSYQQINLITDYYCQGFLKNMSIQMLLAWKGNLEKTPVDAKNIINRVNMLNSSLIVNYSF